MMCVKYSWIRKDTRSEQSFFCNRCEQSSCASSACWSALYSTIPSFDATLR